MMLKKIFFVCSFLLISNQLFSQSSICDSNIPGVCAGEGLLFENTSDNSVAQAGPDYGCLGDQPNPAWFKLKIKNDGDWNFEIAQNTQSDFQGFGLDVDFICYGPFVENTDYCSNLTAANNVSCSYSLNVIESMSISNALEDEIYILLITNYDGAAGFINFNQIGYDPDDSSTHATDCSIVDNITICGNDTHDIDVTDADPSATYSWEFDDGTGAITIPGETSPILQVPTDLDGDGNVDALTGQYIATILISAVENSSISNVFFGTIYNPGTSVDNMELCEGDVTPQDLEAAIGPHDDGDGTGFWSDDDASGVVLGTATAVDFSGIAAGIYHYSYTIPGNNGCPTVNATVTLTISELLVAGGVTTPIGFCETETVLQDLTAALNGADAGGDWTADAANPSTVDLTTPEAIDFSLALDGIYNFTYSFTGSGSCPDSSETVTVTIDNIAYAGDDFSFEFCEGETTTQDLFGSLGLHPTTGESADLGGVWTADIANPSLVDLSTPTTVDFSLALDGEYKFMYTFAATPNCQISEGVITIIISNLADTGVDSGLANYCEGEATPQDLTLALIGADLGGDWIETSAVASGVLLTNPTAVDFSNVVFGEYTFEYFFDVIGSCQRVSTEVVVTISEYFSPGMSNTLVLCVGDNTPQSLFNELGGTAEWGGDWLDDNATLINISDINNVDFNMLPVGDYNFTYTHQALGACPITDATITVSIIAIPTSISLELTYCDTDNDGFGFFDLNDATALITNGDNTISVSYYESIHEADLGTDAGANIPTNVPFQNVDTDGNGVGDSQTLHIRVDSLIADCYNIAETLELIVINSPVLPSEEIIYAQCETVDDPSTIPFDEGLDEIILFDLTSYEQTDIYSEIINTAGGDATVMNQYSTVYYTELDASENPVIASEILTPNAFENETTPDQTIYVVVTHIGDATVPGTGCSTQKAITLHVDLLPTAEYTQIEMCDNNNVNDLENNTSDGIIEFNLTAHISAITGGTTGVNIEFYTTAVAAEAGLGTATIPSENFIATPSAYTNSVNPQAIFARVYNLTTECYVVALVNLHVNPNPTPLSNQEIKDNLGNNGVMDECDGNVDGSGDVSEQVAEFDLTKWEVQILNGESGVSASYYTSEDDAAAGINTIDNPAAYINISNPQTIYVSVLNDGFGINPITEGTGCYTIVEFELNIPIPELSISADKEILCVDAFGIPLTNASLPLLTVTATPTLPYDYQWMLNGVAISGATNETYSVTVPGDYTVIVSGPTDLDCMNVSQAITIEESGIPQEFNGNVTTNAFSDSHQIVAEATSNISGIVFWYTLDNGEPTTNGTFDNVSPGIHTVTISDGENCWETTETVTLIDYPHFFTPNGDGINDTWTIIGQEEIPISQIYIFDRFGKLLKQLDPDGEGWDGTYNGSQMHASDYWFKIIYIEGSDSNQREFKAHFSLKR